MRPLLEWIYRASGVAAAIFLLAIAVTVLIQVGFNALDRLAEIVTGEAVGLVLPSYAEFTGYFLATATFLAAANALKAGTHIRVNLIIKRLGPKARHVTEVWCAGAGAVFTAYFTYWAGNLTIESWQFSDVSPGIIPVPIWIPQLSMVIGLLVLTIALIDECITIARGGQPSGLDEGDVV